MMTNKELQAELHNAVEWAGDEWVELLISTEAYDTLLTLLSTANEPTKETSND